MASIIIMRSDELLDSFLTKFNVENYNFIAISDDIKTTQDESNVFSLKRLLPPSKALTCMINGNDIEGYFKKYFRYLSRPEVEIFLTTIVKLAVMEDSNVVLLCSKAEDEMKYLKAIKKYLETVYHVNVYSYKKYKKNPKKCDSVENKKKTEKILKEKIKRSQNVRIELDKDEVLSRLKHMSTQAIIDFAKANDIKVKKSMSRKEVIKKITKAMD